MKRKIFSKLLMVAMLIASVSTFVSCKDYDDDIKKNSDAISALQQTLNNLQSALDQAKSDAASAHATFATKVELGQVDSAVKALQEEIKTLATKKALEDAIAEVNAAIAKGATKDELAELSQKVAAINTDLDAIGEWQKTTDQAISTANENIKKQEEALGALALLVADKADKTALEAAVEALEKAIEAGDKKNADAITALETALKKAIAAGDNKNAEAITALEKVVGTKADAKALQEAVEKLNKAISDLASDVKTELAKKANQSALEALAKLVGANTEAIKANKDAIAEVNTALTNSIAKAVERIAEVENTMATASELQQVKNAMKDADDAIREDLGDRIDLLQAFLAKRLSSIVLKPNFYWEGIEGIEAPFIYQTPVFKPVNKEYTFKYRLINAPAGNDIVKVTVKKYMSWDLTGNASDDVKALNNREYSIYVNENVPASHATLPIYGHLYTGTTVPKLKATAANYKTLDSLVKKTDIAYGAVAEYHINPSTADLEGATIGFYDHSAPTYTRGDAAPSISPVAKETTFSKDGAYNKLENGILTVPFEVNYQMVLRYFLKWTNPQTTNWEGTPGGSWGRWYETGDVARMGKDVAYFKMNDKATGATVPYYTYNGHKYEYAGTVPGDGLVTLPSKVVGPEWATQGGEDQDNLRDNDDWAYNGYLPYVSLQVGFPSNDEMGVADDYTVNSDYAVVVPAMYKIVALADKAPEEGLDLKTFTKPGLTHEIRKNHLYETVGYDDQVRATDNPLIADPNVVTWNEQQVYGAIPMPATHSVVYNKSIDLMDFVETHYDYTTFAQYGKSTQDQVMSDELMEQLNLHYEFTVIDYTIGEEKTSESAHIQQHDGKAPGSKFVPRSVTEDGETIKDEPATVEVCDREPLIRVDLVRGTGDTKEIIRYGYIKLRIVKDEISLNDLEVTINLKGDYYMNCGDEGKVTWSQVENLILKQLNNQAGMTKQDFEKYYKLDVYGNYKFMPYITPGNITDNTDKAGKLYTKSWQAKRFFKGAKGYVPAIDGDFTKCDDDSLAQWTEANNHFGEVWYTPHDNSTEGHNWDEQTNVLIWNLYPGDELAETDIMAYRKTYNATLLGKETAGGMNKAKYHAMRKVVGIDYDNHKSTKALSTVVRFINKVSGTSIWVTLVIPEQKIEFNWGEIENKDWSHWWKINTQTRGIVQATAPYWDEFDTHMNTPVPAYVGYRWLKIDDFKQDLRDYWHAPESMVAMKGTKDKFDHFAPKTDKPYAAPSTEFIFVTPQDQVNSDGVSASTIMLKETATSAKATVEKKEAWNVYGASGTKWTLQIAADGKKIVAVGKNDVVYGPEDVCELIANGVTGDNQKTVLYYHGVEEAANLYPAATDLVNKSGRYDETGAKRFGAGSAMGEQEDVKYLEKNVDETFTAYIKINVTHYCYDPLISKQYFNVRVLRPINVAGKEKKIKDIPNVMQKISLQDLVDIIDYRDIPVVGRYAAEKAADKTAFGIKAPKWEDVVADKDASIMTATGSVKEQNAGVPYEFYKIQDLAVMYSEILSDHQAPYAFREAGALRTAADIAAALKDGNVKAVKDIPSLRGGLEGKDYNVKTNPRVLSLWSNDDVHSLKVADAWTTDYLVDMTQNNTHSKGIGKIEYTNNSGITQLFHIYVPIAVKYNWGNIKFDNTFNKPAKLDNNYTQKVWAVITVDPSYLGE